MFTKPHEPGLGQGNGGRRDGCIKAAAVPFVTWLKGHVEMKAVRSRLPHFPRCWFLFDSFFFSVIQAPNIHIDSYDENSLSFTLTMNGDIKVTWSSQTGSWVGLSFVWELVYPRAGRLGAMKGLL